MEMNYYEHYTSLMKEVMQENNYNSEDLQRSLTNIFNHKELRDDLNTIAFQMLKDRKNIQHLTLKLKNIEDGIDYVFGVVKNRNIFGILIVIAGALFFLGWGFKIISQLLH